MLFKTFSAAVFGVDAYLVEVEVDVAPAFEGHFTVVGLPDIAVKESRERIRAALRNCGFDFPATQSPAPPSRSIFLRASCWPPP
jgi:magnesium chelatase family protein